MIGKFCNRFVPIPVLSLCRPSSGRFEDPWADEDTLLGHPEKDVLSYLETCASALGVALDLEAKIGALRKLRSVTLRGAGEGIAVSRAKLTTGNASSSALGEFGRLARNDSDVLKNGAAERGNGVKNKTVTLSSAQDVYAAVTTALSRALVHCKRFEVCGGKRKRILQI